MSDHTIPIVKINAVGDHPHADRLSITHVDGWCVVFQKGTFAPGDLAVFVPPDFTVNVEKPGFEFLKDKAKADGRARVRPVSLRGICSQGILVPVPSRVEAIEGLDVSGVLDIQRYEPPFQGDSNSGDMRGAPPIRTHKFDVESYQKYGPKMLVPGEPLIVTEKIHGANLRCVWVNNELWVGSRTTWKTESESNVFWRAFRSAGPGLVELLKTFPETTVYGEAYGAVQNLRYGLPPGEVRLAVFAMMRNDGTWVNWERLKSRCRGFDVAHVPYLMTIDYCPTHIEFLKKVIEDDSSLCPGGIREGVVLVPRTERVTKQGKRVAVKMVSNRYLTHGP